MAEEKTILKCADCKKEFNVIPQENKFYKDKKLPLPDQCPACRHKLRMSLRNERKLYKRICDKCKTPMLSTYPKEAPYTVYCQKCFWENIG